MRPRSGAAFRIPLLSGLLILVAVGLALAAGHRLALEPADIDLPRDGEGETVLDLALVAAADLADVQAVEIAIHHRGGAAVAPGVVRLELPPAPVRAPAGVALPIRLVVAPGALDSAGDYRLEVTLRFVSGSAEALSSGPPLPEVETLRLRLVRPAADLAMATAMRVETRLAVPWNPAAQIVVDLRVSETGGLSRLPPDLAVRERGRLQRQPDGVAVGPVEVRLLGLAPVAGAGAADLRLEVTGALAAGRYRLPLELYAPAILAPLPVDLEIWVRHESWWLIVALGLGLGLGLTGRLLAARRRQAEAEAARAIDSRIAIDELRQAAIDEGLRGQLDRATSAPAALAALRDHEARRLVVEGQLVDLEDRLLLSPSDPPEVASALALGQRRAVDLRHRLERGELSLVEEDLDRLGDEVAARVGEAGRLWLCIARDLLDALRQRMAAAAHALLVEAVRHPLETYANRVAAASPDHLRETIAAGRNATATLTEQVFALGFRHAYRDLGEALTVLTDLAPEGAVAAAEAARLELALALEPGDLGDPARPIAALARYAGSVEAALESLAGDSWSADTWKAVREAAALREYARAAETAELVLRQRLRERPEARRRTRVLEVVRLKARPPAPQARLLWDGPACVGFPVLVRLVFLGSAPPRYSVRWLADGQPVQSERRAVESAAVTFERPGYASLRAVVEIEGDAQTLVAQSRLRVLPATLAGSRPAPGRGGGGWRALQILLAAALACGLGFVVLAPRFAGTGADYALAVGFGLLAELTADRVRALIARG